MRTARDKLKNSVAFGNAQTAAGSSHAFKRHARRACRWAAARCACWSAAWSGRAGAAAALTDVGRLRGSASS